MLNGLRFKMAETSSEEQNLAANAEPLPRELRPSGPIRCHCPSGLRIHICAWLSALSDKFVSSGERSVNAQTVAIRARQIYSATRSAAASLLRFE